MQPIPKRSLGGKSGAAVSAIGLGLMGMSEFYGARDDEESIRGFRFIPASPPSP